MQLQTDMHVGNAITQHKLKRQQGRTRDENSEFQLRKKEIFSEQTAAKYHIPAVTLFSPITFIMAYRECDL